MAGRPRSGARREVKELNDVGFVVIPGPAALLRLHRSTSAQCTHAREGRRLPAGHCASWTT